MDPDLNKYDLEHVTMSHSQMSNEEWAQIYRRAWDLYYSPEHIKTLIRRAAAGGPNPSRVMLHIHQFHGTIKYQNVHPLQGGFLRRKVRTQRRPGMPQENPVTFYPLRVFSILREYGKQLAALYLLLYIILNYGQYERKSNANREDAPTRIKR